MSSPKRHVFISLLFILKHYNNNYNNNNVKRAVVHIRRGVHYQQSFRRDIVRDRVPTLEEGRQYKFLCVLETLAQEEKTALEPAAKEFLRRLSVIWSSPLSDYNRVVASNQFALTGYRFEDRRQRSAQDYRGERRETPGGSTALLYLPRENGGRGLRAVKTEYKVTKVKEAVRLYENKDPVKEMWKR